MEESVKPTLFVDKEDKDKVDMELIRMWQLMKMAKVMKCNPESSEKRRWEMM